MDKEPRILMLEDDPSDAELADRALRQAGLRFSMDRVADREAFVKALQAPPPDLMLIDYNLPAINGQEALALARQHCPGVPFIFVSGIMGEELAVDTLKQGATDYVLKARLSRLAPAVRRALEEARLRAERRRAEAALQESADQYRAMVETTGTGYVIVDLEGRVLGANPEYVRMTGRRALDEIRGRSVLGWTADHAKAKNAQAVAQCAKEGRIRNLEIDYVDPRGRITPVEINATVVTANGVAQILALCRDISERRKAEAERARLLESEQKARAEAEAASRAKDEFLALVSHELRTPITAIMGWNWLLRSGELSPPERKRALEVIDRSMQTEKQIIDELLDVSSMVRRQLSLKKQTLDLGKLVAETAAGFQAELRAKSLRLVCAPAAGLLMEGDPRRLRQVFWNLVSNAVKFTPEGGTVTVLARRAEGQVLVSVEDTGPGIGPEFYGQLFELFRQQEACLTRVHGGLGLGLAIVKHLVDLHGGAVSVAPPVPGRGARIGVSLPLAPRGRDYLSRVRGGTRRLARMIDGFLKLSRAGRAELQRKPMDLGALARDAVTDLRRSNPGRDVEFTAAGDLRAEGDGALLRIVLDNLLGNAWKFTAKTAQAKVEFGVVPSGDERAFCVRDNGAGFDASRAGKLFGAFQRLHGSAEFPGSGIGLATVRRIIHRHGGRVWAEGEVGKGAAVYFTLPSRPDPEGP
ncbi:MAG: ATP-binding protein [Elusimicrobia bacterium]|nr:ATP-binding protein [Elusimicrobiota bacterium]